ncbi:solute carrier family 22 member 7-like isoform X1 [Osmerus eperlanus]|uniref:solute carrier family 22 member 7-like isoform X1 n=1 Tax=Osmerus eperlanus TaxID=29151 RepID=UPI002E0EAAFC
MKFDNVLSEINGCGKYQIMIILIQSISRLSLPCHFLLNNFIAAMPSHHCNLSGLDNGSIFGNLTQEQRLVVSIPQQEDGVPNSCEMFPEPQYQLLSNSSSMTNAATVQCQNGWVYDHSTFTSTVATEWDLVCNGKAMNKATATLYFIGVMCGAPLFGFLSDRFGRRTMLMVSYLSSMAFATMSAFSTSYLMFVIMRFFTGFALAGISIISFVLNVEWFDIHHRTFAGVIVSLDWTLGNWLLVGIAYFVRDWRRLILAATSPLLLSVFAWRWLPESARWLVASGQAEKAHGLLRQCAHINKRSMPMADITPEMLVKSVTAERSHKKYTLIDLVRTPNIRKLTICTGIVWFGVAFTYYGISLNITGFGLNIYLTQFLYAFIEMPGKIGVFYFLKKIGRKPGQVWTLLLTGLCLLISMWIPKDMREFSAIVSIIGKGLSEGSFTIIYLYTIELFPTVVRQNGLGYTAFVARLGVSIAPLIFLLEDVWQRLPAVIYCMVAIGSGLVASLLPETLNICLPEFIEDIEKPRAESKLGRNQTEGQHLNKENFSDENDEEKMNLREAL